MSYEMELDKRVGDYAAAIVRDADLLLTDTANLTDQQKHFTESFKRVAVRLVSVYNELLPYCADRTVEPGAILHEIRAPLYNIRAYCELFLSGQIGNFSPSQRQLIQQIQAAQEFVLDEFTMWMNSIRGESKNG